MKAVRAIHVGVLTIILSANSHAQAPAPTVSGQTFEVVSVKPCDPNTPASSGRGGSANASPDRLVVVCQSLFNLIHSAYVAYADGRLNQAGTAPSDPDKSAGPEWMSSDRFTIEAKAKGATPMPVMLGPMLQTILEDRFKLKIHRETREEPVYELVVAKGGSKLSPFEPGACVPRDWNASPPPLQPGQHWCGANSYRSADDRNWVLDAEGMTLDEVAALFSTPDRPVINKTGLAGRFGFRLVYEGGRIAAVKDQLGLEMRPANGVHEFLIVDHAERPTPN